MSCSPRRVEYGAERRVAEVLRRRCGWCEAELPPERPRYCSKRCRQTAWRARKLAVVEGADGAPRRLGYGDPPYPGKAFMYRGHPDYAGEVDHQALIARLTTFEGWALSTDEEALQDVLPMCPKGVRVASWCKPNPAAQSTRGPHKLWEPVIYMPARERKPGVRNWLMAKPARGGGETLIGRKPLKFWLWLFELLGAQPGDDFDDLFPGTGWGQRAFGQFCASPGYRGDAKEKVS